MRIVGIREKGFWGWKKKGPYGILLKKRLDKSFIKISKQQPGILDLETEENVEVDGYFKKIGDGRFDISRCYKFILNNLIDKTSYPKKILLYPEGILSLNDLGGRKERIGILTQTEPEGIKYKFLSPENNWRRKAIDLETGENINSLLGYFIDTTPEDDLLGFWKSLGDKNKLISYIDNYDYIQTKNLWD